MENIHNRVKIKIIKKDDNDKINKQQPKLPFNGIHNYYTNYDGSTFEQNDFFWISQFT